MDTKEILTRLAKVERDAIDAIPYGWTLPDALNIDFSDLMMDMLGVHAEGYAHEDAREFCRDYGYEQWRLFVGGEIDVDVLVARVMS